MSDEHGWLVVERNVGFYEVEDADGTKIVGDLRDRALAERIAALPILEAFARGVAVGVLANHGRSADD